MNKLEKTTKELMEEKKVFNEQIDEQIRVSMLLSTEKNIALRDVKDVEKQKKENDGWNSSRIRPISEREREIAEELDLAAEKEAEELTKQKEAEKLAKQKALDEKQRLAEQKTREEEEALAAKKEADRIVKEQAAAKRKADLEAKKAQKLKELAELEAEEV